MLAKVLSRVPQSPDASSTIEDLAVWSAPFFQGLAQPQASLACWQ